jgi:uncharacterized protein (TIGR02246 family)
MNETVIAEIIAETQAFAAAMNAGDATLASSFYTEDGRRVGASGDVQNGREEIAAAYDRLLHETMPGVQLIQERGTVRMLSPGMAVWQGGLELDVPGSDVPLRGHVVQVMKKVEDRWLILEGHPKFFPSAPGTDASRARHRTSDVGSGPSGRGG